MAKTGEAPMTDWNGLKNQLANGTIDRRQFMQNAAALGIAASVAGSVCSKAAKAQTPRLGGRIRVGLAHGSTSDSLDPAVAGQNGFMGVLNYANHNHLGDIGLSGTLEPELAESWEGSDGGAKWHFKLRKDVEFHNGKTMDANDVVASINYHRGDDSKSAGKPLLADITDIVVDGPNSFNVTLATGNVDFPYTISEQYFYILPSKEGKINWTDRVASGPFVLEEFEPGVRAFLSKNPNYFKEGRPYFDELEMLTIADPTARVTALKTGGVDLIDRPDLKTANLLARESSIRLEETQGMLHYTLPMLGNVAPFDDNNVRMALKHALDRDALVKTVLHGHGVVGNDHPISKISPHHASHLEQRQYDVDKAKYYLKQAGLDTLSVDIHLADAAFSGAVDAGVLYREHAAKAGIDINVVREPNDGYWSNVWMQKPWCASYWLGRVSTDAVLQISYARDAEWNEIQLNNDRFDMLLSSARAEFDEDKRREMYFEIQEIIRDDSGQIVPMFGNYVFAASSKLQHGEMRADRDLDGQKFSERWWFA